VTGAIRAHQHERRATTAGPAAARTRARLDIRSSYASASSRLTSCTCRVGFFGSMRSPNRDASERCAIRLPLWARDLRALETAFPQPSRLRPSRGARRAACGRPRMAFPPAPVESSSRWASRQKSSSRPIVAVATLAAFGARTGGPFTGHEDIVVSAELDSRAGCGAGSGGTSSDASADVLEHEVRSAPTAPPPAPRAASCRSASVVARQRRSRRRGASTSTRSIVFPARRPIALEGAGSVSGNTSAPSEREGAHGRNPVGSLAAHEGGDGESRRGCEG